MVSAGDDAEDVPEVQELQMERREVARRFLRAVAGRIWFKTESKIETQAQDSSSQQADEADRGSSKEKRVAVRNQAGGFEAMKLFHFCAPQFLESIKSEGLTLGCTPVVSEGRIGFLKNQQWLTRNPSFEQSWNGRVSVKYDRAAYRLTISIPKSSRMRLLAFIPDYRKYLGEMMLPDFDADEDCKNWFVFIGHVSSGWIREIKKRPESNAIPLMREA